MDILKQFFVVGATLCCALANSSTLTPGAPRVLRFPNSTCVELSNGKDTQTIRVGEHFGAWTLMAIIENPQSHAANRDSLQQSTDKYIVLEDFQHRDGHILFVNSRGVQSDFPKTSESGASDAHHAYLLGHSREQIQDSDIDLLGRQILSQPGDPEYAEVAGVFPPIQKIKSDTFSFVGTPDTADKVGFTLGGRSPNFDPAVYQPSIADNRRSGNVWHGLVGGYLPVLRFVYPQANGDWTELLAFAPFHIANHNNRIQPVWYRVSRVENGVLRWSRYIDTYLPFPPRDSDTAQNFYRDLTHSKNKWDNILKPAMQIDVPDQRIANMARLSLIRAIMTRVGDFPKYGVFDKDYGGSEHDGFPDTFNVETTAMLDWGLLDRAGRYIDNYFGEFVRDDGSILYRGPETGQFGRMLTVVAQYVNDGGDPQLLLKQRTRIDAIAKVLLSMRAKALQLPKNDPAYGMLAGWSEADSSLEENPSRYMQPYFSNSTEAARGFRDLGQVWESLGRKTSNSAMIAWGQQLLNEAAALRKDIDVAMSRSMLAIDTLSENSRGSYKTMLPAIAGGQAPFDVAVHRDIADPQFRDYRAYNEMMYSGSLTSTQLDSIVSYRESHRDVILGMPVAYNKRELAGFLSYGYGFGLIQFDKVREALLLLYSDMAHQYTRGMWTAPETRRPLSLEEAAPYCSLAQLVEPLLTRWLLVFEDPESQTLWLAKATPREWLADGKRISVDNAPTKWGRVGFSIVSHANGGSIEAHIKLPEAGLRAEIKLRLRIEGDRRIKSVTLNDKAWTQFDTASEVITVPAGMGGDIHVVAHY